jgi:hypothetical protein
MAATAATASTPPEYFIGDGVHRAVAIHQNGGGLIPARLFVPGQPPKLIFVRLDQLHSPRTSVSRSDPRHQYSALEAALADPKNRAAMRPVDIQPLGAAGQPASVPLAQVQIVK